MEFVWYPKKQLGLLIAQCLCLWEAGYYLDIDLARVLDLRLNVDYAPVKSGMGIDWGTRKVHPQVFGETSPSKWACFFV